MEFMKNKRELIPIYEGVQGYYKKAIIIEDNDRIRLKSYQTTMVVILKSDNALMLNNNLNNYTPTTLRHVKEFLKQNENILIKKYPNLFIEGKKISKKDILALIN